MSGHPQQSKNTHCLRICSERPSVNTILKMPFINRRISKYLPEEVELLSPSCKPQFFSSNGKPNSITLLCTDSEYLSTSYTEIQYLRLLRKSTPRLVCPCLLDHPLSFLPEYRLTNQSKATEAHRRSSVPCLRSLAEDTGWSTITSSSLRIEHLL